MLKKKTICLIFVLVGSSLALFCSDSYAQTDYRRGYLKDSLQVSLMSLRQKAQEVTQRNNWLWTQIQTLKREIPRLKARLAAADNPASSAVGNMSSPLEPPLNADYQNFETPYRSKQELQSEIARVSATVGQLQQQIAAFDRREVPPGGPPAQAKEEALGRIQQLQNKIESSEKYLQQIQKKHGRRAEIYSSLLDKQTLLKEKLTLLENELHLAMRENNKLEKEIQSVKTDQKTTFSQTHQNVHQLRENGELLEKTLKRAHNKIKNQKINFDITDKELSQLMDSLALMRKEKKRLEGHYIQLTQKYEKVKKGMKSPSAGK